MPASNPMRRAFPSFNGYAPKEGPKALPVDFDFSSVGSAELNLLLENTEGQIQYVQSMWVDNSDNPGALTIRFGGTNQRVVIPANAQGNWPVITIDQVRATISSPINAAARGQIIFLNVPMPMMQFGPITVNTAAAVLRGSWSDFSGTVAVGGTSQALIPANAARNGILIQNPTSEIEPLFINFDAAASVAGGSIELLPGQIWPPDQTTVLSSQAINVTAATAAHRFIAKELV